MSVKKIGYYKKLSKIINDTINYMQYYRIKIIAEQCVIIMENHIS